MLLLKYLKFSLLINFKNLSEQEEDSILDQMDTLWYASNKLELLIIRYFTKSIYIVKRLLKLGRGVHSKEFHNESPKISAKQKQFYNCKIFAKSGKII